jgi:hypothetical protein
MINRFISMRMEYVEVANELQKYYNQIGPRESYLFYSQLLPKGRQWNKYIGKSSGSHHPDWLVELIAKHFYVSQHEAESYLDIYRASEEGKESLKEICMLYGIDPRKLGKI